MDYLVREATQRILLLCLARPDLVEQRPEWESTDVVELEPLSTADVESLVVDRAGSIGPDVVRAALHERFADWLGRTSPHSTPEFHEVLGHHLEQAMDHRRASGIGGAAGAPSLTGPSGRQPIDEARESS